MARVLGIDASTQSCSGLVIDTSAGTIFAEVSVNYGQSFPRYGSPNGFIPNGANGEVHADPAMWLDGLEQLFVELAKVVDLTTIAAVCGAGQQHGSVYLNYAWFETVRELDAGRSLAEQIRPCLSRATAPIWMDTSTTAECAEITAAVGSPGEVCSRSGSIAIERFTGPQIRRFSKNHPNEYAATARIHLVSSFHASVIAGADVALDTGDASGMNLLDLSTGTWDDLLVAATTTDLLPKLPEVKLGQTIVGTVAAWLQQRHGFRANVPVIVFTGDNPSSLVGMGASRPGKCVVSLGTSDTIFAAMPATVTDADGFGHAFGNPSGGTMALQCFVNGSLAREALRDRFGYDWDRFTGAFAKTPPGADGNRLLPFIRPEISPRHSGGGPFPRGDDAFDAGGEDVGDLWIRAGVEAQFVNMRARCRWMGLAADGSILLTGGASRNDAIAQVVADVFQKPVDRLTVSGSVALGAALRAASVGLGESLEALEAVFCTTAASKRLEPNPATIQPYAETEADLLQCITETSS